MSIHVTAAPFTAPALLRQMTDEYEPVTPLEIGRFLVFDLMEFFRDEIENSMEGGLGRDCHMYPYSYVNFPHDRVTDEMVDAVDELNRTGETGFRFAVSQDRESVNISW